MQEDPNRGEKQRLREYEYLVDQSYDPFHEKCRRNVFFSDRKLIATRRSGWNEGIVFSARPIPLNGIFQVKLLERGDDEWLAGSLVSARSNLPHTLYVVLEYLTKMTLSPHLHAWFQSVGLYSVMIGILMLV